MKSEILYRELNAAEIDRALFSAFIRRQVVTDCRRKLDGRWVTLSDPFVDDWDEADYQQLLCALRQNIQAGGYVAGAFSGTALKGFVSVAPNLFGSLDQYMDLAELHVSQEQRGRHIGRELFLLAKAYAKKNGAQKLYLSAHSAVESQAFYRAMGCVEAAEYSPRHVEKEPCDCQLECAL